MAQNLHAGVPCLTPRFSPCLCGRIQQSTLRQQQAQHLCDSAVLGAHMLILHQWMLVWVERGAEGLVSLLSPVRGERGLMGQRHDQSHSYFWHDLTQRLPSHLEKLFEIPVLLKLELKNAGDQGTSQRLQLDPISGPVNTRPHLVLECKCKTCCILSHRYPGLHSCSFFGKEACPQELEVIVINSDHSGGPKTCHRVFLQTLSPQPGYQHKAKRQLLLQL